MDCQSLVRVDKGWNCEPFNPYMLSTDHQVMAYDAKNQSVLCVVENLKSRAIRRFKIDNHVISDCYNSYDDDHLVTAVTNFHDTIYITKHGRPVKGKLTERYFIRDGDFDTKTKCANGKILVVEDAIITYFTISIEIITKHCVFKAKIPSGFNIIHPLADGTFLFLKQIRGRDYSGQIRKSWNHGFEIIKEDISLNFRDIINDHLGNVVLLKDGAENRSMVEIYNCQLQLLSTYYLEEHFHAFSFTVDPDLQEFIIAGNSKDPTTSRNRTEIHLYDIPYST